MCFSSVILTWLISSIPLLANSNTSSVGCTAVVMAAEFRGQGAALKYPGYDYFGLLSFHLAKWLPLSSSRFSDLGRLGRSERERPQAGFQRSAVAQVGAASSLSDTEAGSRCAWSIYTWRRGRARDGGLRLGGILDHFNFAERQERQGGAEVAQRKSACAGGDRNPEWTVQITDVWSLSRTTYLVVRGWKKPQVSAEKIRALADSHHPDWQMQVQESNVFFARHKIKSLQRVSGLTTMQMYSCKHYKATYLKLNIRDMTLSVSFVNSET